MDWGDPSFKISTRIGWWSDNVYGNLENIVIREFGEAKETFSLIKSIHSGIYPLISSLEVGPSEPNTQGPMSQIGEGINEIEFSQHSR